MRLLISFSPWKEQGRKEKKLVSLARNSGSSIKYVSNFSYIFYDLSHICTFLYLSLFTKQLISSVKFRYCEQAKRFEKISHFFGNYLVVSNGRFFQKNCGLLTISELQKHCPIPQFATSSASKCWRTLWTALLLPEILFALKPKRKEKSWFHWLAPWCDDCIKSCCNKKSWHYFCSVVKVPFLRNNISWCHITAPMICLFS